MVVRLENDNKISTTIGKDRIQDMLFHGGDGEDFSIWTLRILTALREEQLIGAVTEENVDANNNEMVLLVIVPALGDNSLRAILEFITLVKH